jgi:type I restriction enzyme, S subunit
MKEYTIGEISESFQNGIGKGISFYGRGIKVANIGDLYEFPIFQPVKYSLLEVDEKEKERYLLKTGDLLFVRSSLKREGVAYCSMYNSSEECLFSSFMIRVRLKKNVCDPRYVSYILRGDVCRERLINASNTSTITNINQDGLSTVQIPLPPLETQKKIAAILDAADEYRQKTKTLIEKYDQLAQSLFLDMFGDPLRNEEEWKEKKLEEVCAKITDGTHFSPEPQSKGFPYVTAKHVKEYGLDFYSKPTFISKEAHNEIYKRCTPEYGDVLYIKDGATTGIACINTFKEPISLLSSLALLKLNKTEINNFYLCYWLNHKGIKEQLLKEYMSGAAIQRYTLTKINSFVITIPPLPPKPICRAHPID